jgi:hypothetical protein
VLPKPGQVDRFMFEQDAGAGSPRKAYSAWGKSDLASPLGDRAKRAKDPSASFFATPSSGTGDALVLVRRRTSVRRIGPRNLERAA